MSGKTNEEVIFGGICIIEREVAIALYVNFYQEYWSRNISTSYTCIPVYLCRCWFYVTTNYKSHSTLLIILVVDVLILIAKLTIEITVNLTVTITASITSLCA